MMLLFSSVLMIKSLSIVILPLILPSDLIHLSCEKEREGLSSACSVDSSAGAYHLDDFKDSFSFLYCIYNLLVLYELS